MLAFFFFLAGRGETQKSRFTLCTIPYCLGSQWIREEQVARRPSHPTSPRPSNVDICSFMDCLGIQFNSEFPNMKVNPWCFTITLYLECSFSSFFIFFSSVLEVKACFEAGHRGKQVGNW